MVARDVGDHGDLLWVELHHVPRRAGAVALLPFGVVEVGAAEQVAHHGGRSPRVRVEDLADADVEPELAPQTDQGELRTRAAVRVHARVFPDRAEQHRIGSNAGGQRLVRQHVAGLLEARRSDRPRPGRPDLTRPLQRAEELE